MYLLGASGHAKVIIDSLELSGVKIDGVFDKNETITSINSYEVKPEESLTEDLKILIAIGDNKIRESVAQKFFRNAYVNAVHPTAILAKSVKLGKGVAIMAGVTINSDTIISDHCIINTSASIDHDCQVDDFVHIAPNATLCGGISVGKGTLVGAGAVLIPNLKIGEWVTIGAGAVVTSDVPDGSKVVGNPARIIEVSR